MTGAITFAAAQLVTEANGGTGLTSAGTVGNVLTSTGSAWVSSAVAPSFSNNKAYFFAGF